MSLSSSNLNLIPTIDPRLDVEKLQKLLYGVETVASDSLYKVFPITSINSSNFSVTANPSNKGVFIDRKIFLQIKFILTFNGNSGSAGRTLLQCAGLPSTVSTAGNTAFYDAPRAYGLSNSLSSIKVQFNGADVSTNLQEYIRALTRYSNNVECQDKDLGFSPTMLDQSLNYSDLAGFNRDPLRGYGDNDLQCPRGGFINCVVTRNDSTGTNNDVAIVELTLMEPIYLSPMANMCRSEQPSFYDQSTLSINGNFKGRGNTNQGLISTLWSHSTSSLSTFSSFNVVADAGSSNLIYLELKPPLGLPMPMSTVYDYVEPFYTSTIKSAQLTRTQANLKGDNIQLNSIPERVYIWVNKQDADSTWTDTDTYFSIEQIGITFNTRSGILQEASPEMLYTIANRNFTNSNYRQFRKDVGSVLCLRFGEDIPLANLLVPGSRGSYDFVANVSATNNYSVTVTPQINFLFMYTGTFKIENGTCSKHVGILTQQDVLNVIESKQAPIPSKPPFNALGSGALMGGSMMGGFSWGEFLDFFKKAGRTAINVGKAVAPILAPQFVPGLEVADRVASAVGVGRRSAPRRSAPSRSSGGTQIGGKKLSRTQMLNMLQR